MAEIDREKVIEGLEAIREFFRFGLPSQTTVFEVYQNILTDAIVLLEEQKHGEWINIWSAEDPDIFTEGRCSVCKRISERPLGEYCKWCGAKMDGGEKDA